MLLSALAESGQKEFAQKAGNRNLQQVCRDGVASAMEVFSTKVSDAVLEILGSPESKRTLSRRFAKSSLGLLVDDWRHFPNRQA